MKKYRYNICNLDCANCAREIEEELNKNEELNNVIVNFSTSKLSYESNCDITIKELNKLIRKVEPDSYLIEDEGIKEKKEYNIIILIISLITGIIGIYFDLPKYTSMILILVSYILLIYRPFINAIKILIKSKSINENFLITVSCIGAYLINQKAEGIMVLFLYTLGKILEEKAINNTRNSIKELLDIKQDYANKKENNEIVKIDVEDIRLGDTLVVKKGEKVPVDGIVIKGTTSLDTSALTGESELFDVNETAKVLSGSINIKNVIEIKVTNLYKDSMVFKILELVEDATDKKTKTETFVSSISKIYTPIIIFLAIIITIILPIFTNINYSESLYRGLTFLVISCPCAIAISVPLSYFTGIGIASKNGILIKGSNYLDTIGKVDSIIFDKTGTLTTGQFEVKNIEIFDNNYNRDEIISILIKGESLSNHPIAKSIMKLKTEKPDNSDVINYKEEEGKGISFEINKDIIKIGTKKTCNCEKDTNIHLNINGNHVASITIDDGIKTSAFNCIKDLRNLGITTYMFTGDKKEIALEIGKTLEIDKILFEMLPTDKYLEYENIALKGNTIAFIGDGINDAPVLKRADVGISMGGIGSTSAIEASDIVIMTDDLKKIPISIEISKYTNYIIKQNLIFAISVKLIILILSVVGVASMWSAVFADTGVTLLTIINTLKIMKKFK